MSKLGKIKQAFKKRSIVLDKGVWQYEFLPDKIAVAKWDQTPESTLQWIHICPPTPLMEPKYNKFYLEGNSNDDICVIPYEGHLIVGQSLD